MRQILKQLLIILVIVIPLTKTMGQNINDTVLTLNNRFPIFHNGYATYKLSDFLASDTLKTNISSLIIKSFLIEPDCYCDYDKPSSDGTISAEMKDFVKKVCKRKKFKIAICKIKAVDKLNNEINLDNFVIFIRKK